MSITKEIKRAVEALALAHAADYLSQREKSSVLGALPLSSVGRKIAERPVMPLHQVALVTDTQLPEHLLDYTLDTCRHFNAGLLLIDTQPNQAGRLAASLQEIKAANVPFSVIALPEASVASLHDFALSQPRLLFVILSGATNQALRTAQLQWHCPAPLVVVSEQIPKQAPAAISLRS